MLKHKNTIRGKQVIAEHQVWNIGKVLQLIRRIGKNEIKLRVAGTDVFEYIALYRQASVCLYGFHYLADKAVVSGVFLHAYYVGASSGHQLNAYAACPGKQVKSRCIFKVNPVGQDIEQALFGKISGGTCTECSRHVPPSVFVYTANNSQGIIPSYRSCYQPSCRDHVRDHRSPQAG